MSRFWTMTLVWGLVVTAIWANLGYSDEPAPTAPKTTPAPFVEIGPTLDLRSSVQSDIGMSTTFTLARVKELRIGLVLIKEGEATILDERTYTWRVVPVKLVGPPGSKPEPELIMKTQGAFQVQSHKQGVSQYAMSFWVGFNDHPEWKYNTRPSDGVVEENPSGFSYRQGGKKAGENHIVRIDEIRGKNKGLELHKVKTLDELKTATKDERTAYLVTTLHWLPVD